MNPKYLWEVTWLWGTGVGSHPGHTWCPACPSAYLLFFGWYPQKEIFFSWKKWLHLFPYRREKRGMRVVTSHSGTGDALPAGASL